MLKDSKATRRKLGKPARPEPGVSPDNIIPKIPELPTEELRKHSLSRYKEVREPAYKEWLNRKNSELSETLARAKEKKEKAQSLSAIPQKFSKSKPEITEAMNRLKKEAYDLEARAKQIQAEIEEHTNRVGSIKNIPLSYDPTTPLTVSNIPQIFWDRGGVFKHVKTVLDDTRINLKDVIRQLELHENISVDEAIERAIRFGKPPYHR